MTMEMTSEVTVDAEIVNSWEDDAREFGEYIRYGGTWRFALKVARSVEPGAGHGGNRRQVQDVALDRKVSPTRFAERAGVSRPTVTAYFNAWNHAAALGLVPPSSELRPGAEVIITDDLTPELWSHNYREANARPTIDPLPIGSGSIDDDQNYVDLVGNCGRCGNDFPMAQLTTNAYGFDECQECVISYTPPSDRRGPPLPTPPPVYGQGQGAPRREPTPNARISELYQIAHQAIHKFTYITVDDEECANALWALNDLTMKISVVKGRFNEQVRASSQ